MSPISVADNKNWSPRLKYLHRQTVNHYHPESFFADSTSSLSSLSTSKQEVHAPPIAPLNQRDLLVLTELFDRSDSEAIEADINSKLKMMVPEPAWEEDPYDFLREFL